MSAPQLFDFIPLWVVYGLTVLVALLSMEMGYRLGTAQQRRSPEGKLTDTSGLMGATLALLAFFLAVVTGIAVNRYDTRRQLIVSEANAIGTTYLRSGYLTEPVRTESRTLLREYVDQRLAAFEPGRLVAARARSEAIHEELWARAEVIARENPTSPVVALYIQSLNEVIDLHAMRIIASLHARVPVTLLIVLYFMAILSMLLVGVQNTYQHQHNLIPILIMVLVFSAVIVLIFDLDRPQEGLVTVSHQAFLDLQQQLRP